MSIQVELLSAVTVCGGAFKNRLLRIMEEKRLTLAPVFNLTNKTGLYRKLMSDKTTVSGREKGAGASKSSKTKSH